MKEIEVKILNIDVNSIREKLKKANFSLFKKEFQINYMFDYPDQKLFKENNAIRIRSIVNLLKKDSNISFELTLKELISKIPFKIAKETEFKIDNLTNAIKFLEFFGLNRVRADEKYRESYFSDYGIVEIDIWAGVPPYIEIESSNEKDILTTLQMLGYKLEDTCTTPLSEIMKELNISGDRVFTKKQYNQLRKEYNIEL